MQHPACNSAGPRRADVGVLACQNRGKARPADPFARAAAPAQPQPPAGRAGKYRLGGRVRHPLLGEGVVSGVDHGGDDGGASIIVAFDTGDSIQLLVRYANLEVLD